MKLNRISRKLIKPHTPTPQNLKNYNISFLDQLMQPMIFAAVLFYESKPENNTQLEESLSKILVEFYPLAGRYMKNDHCIDCNDEGVEFVEAEAPDVDLIDLVAKTDANELNDLLPQQYFKIDEAAHYPLMSIQATHFTSGGLTIAISVSHRVFDASSLGTFVAAWSNATNPDSYNKVGLKFKITPSFNLPSLLPKKDRHFGLGSEQINVKGKEIVVKRFLFNKEALTRLRSKLRPNINGKTISKVRVVCAVIAKALIGVDRAKHGKHRDVVITQAINMRERTILPQPKHCCGNLFLPSLRRRVAAAEAKVIGIQELVDAIGDDVRKSIADYAEILSPNRDGRDIITNAFNLMKEVWDPEMNAMLFSDWSKFGFYEADFGLGMPVWASIGPQRPFISAAVLMNDKDGDGIEAWLHLSQNDMQTFEQDEYINSFTM
ncbi:hypothetical protein C2S51_027065 [Perilla frutescens var. frutescens]|nr:hypothetical protein C2S51_027065 [Perilla frutescens var. frutescens]